MGCAIQKNNKNVAKCQIDAYAETHFDEEIFCCQKTKRNRKKGQFFHPFQYGFGRCALEKHRNSQTTLLISTGTKTFVLFKIIAAALTRRPKGLSKDVGSAQKAFDIQANVKKCKQ